MSGVRWRHLAWVVAPAACYLAMRLLGMLLWWGMATLNDRPVDPRAWDGDWYSRIAEYGYLEAAAGMVDANGQPTPKGAMAFFPGYPLLVRLVAPLFAHNYLAAALTVSTLAGVVGAYAVARLARHCGAGRRGELIAVCLVAAAPMSVVYSMAYPEALLIALVSWGLVALLERRWCVAILCAVAAGYVSPMGAPFIPVVIAACLARPARTSWLTKLAALLTPAGIVGYLLWVDVTSGVPGGFMAITGNGWGNKVDFGWGTLRWVYSAFTIDPAAYSLVVAFGIIASIGLLVWARPRLPWLVWAYCLFTLLLALGSGGLPQARMRLLLSAFPLLLPLAVSLARAPARSAVSAMAGFAMFGLWFGSYSLTVWQYAI